MAPTWPEVLGGVFIGGGTCAVAGSLLNAYLQRPTRAVGVPVLRYRLVGRPIPGSPVNDLRLPVSKFEAHVRHLRRRGFVPVTLSEALARRKERAFLDARPVALTFDGPYESFASVAWQILCDHRFNRATLFYPPGYLGEEVLRFQEGRPEPLLGVKTLQRLTEEGVELGVQASVERADSKSSLLSEFRAARQALSQLTGKAPTLICFPFPLEAAVEAAKESGFEGAAVLGDGVLPRSSSPFAIPRYAVQPDTEAIQLSMILGRRVGSELY